MSAKVKVKRKRVPYIPITNELRPSRATSGTDEPGIIRGPKGTKDKIKDVPVARGRKQT